MARARAAILAHGGAARCNVFTRITLALFGQVPWRAVPVMPVEIMLLPRWFPFHLDKVSYWSRTVIVPLLILMACKPRARNPRRSASRSCSSSRRSGSAAISPIRPAPAGDVSSWRSTRSCGSPNRCPRARASARSRGGGVRHRTAERRGWPGRDLSADGAAVMAFETLGYPKDHPDLVIAKRAIRKLWPRTAIGPTASPACRRSGIRRWPATL